MAKILISYNIYLIGEKLFNFKVKMDLEVVKKKERG